MNERGHGRAALAVVAAVAGTGYASGRELVLFFAQLGWAAWIGIPFAAAVFGLLMALACRLAARADAESFPVLCHRLMGSRAAALAGWLRGLLLAVTVVMMLCGAGELGELTLPVRGGFLWGTASALLLALLLNLDRLRPLPWVGLAVFIAGTLFYAALALDPRPVRVFLRGDVRLALEGSPSAAILLGLVYAAMNASLAVGVAIRFGRAARPKRVGALCAAMLGGMLLCANAAVARGGKLLYGQALPTVILSARWGTLGFWVCAGFGYLCAVSTLAAALGDLVDLLRSARHRAIAALAVAAACGAAWMIRGMGAGYAAVGWLCAILTLALAHRAARGARGAFGGPDGPGKG